MILSALAAAKGPENHGDEKSLPLIHLVRNIYINSNLNPLAKFTSSSRSTEFKHILPWNEDLSNDPEDGPNQHENSHKLCDGMGHPVRNLMGSQ